MKEDKAVHANSKDDDAYGVRGTRAGNAAVMDRRRFSARLLSVAAVPIFGIESRPMLELFWAARDQPYPLYDEAVSRVIPEQGFQSKIALKNSVLQLVEQGVIDRGKFFAAYGVRNRPPAEFADALVRPSNEPILLTLANANHFVNLLWPIGLANRMALNAASPINGPSLYGLASTGGWTLGREPNGGVYFNKFPIVKLDRVMEGRVVTIASNTFRPCCNNSTFFQDCNHGSALLGVLELGASQGLSDDELYREALAFNSFWFPDYYVRTALFFKVFRDTDWKDVDPRVVMGSGYSAGGPWAQNVVSFVESVPGLIPPTPGGGVGCGIV